MAEPARAPGSGTAQKGWRRIPVPLVFPAWVFSIGVAAVAALVFGHGLGALPLWRDEAASVAIASRSLAGILAAAGRIDVVHTAYYLLLHPLLGLPYPLLALPHPLLALPNPLLALGNSEALLRLPSLVGVVAAVTLTAELARRLLGLGPAAVTAALLVGNPWLAFYAREARPYALATALVCAAAFALLGGPPTRRRLAVFTGLGVLATWLHLFDLLPALGLLTTWALVLRRGARGPTARPGMWMASAVVLVAAAAPLAVIAAAEARQVSWVGTPTMADVGTLLHDAPGSTIAELAVAVLLVVAGCAAVAGAVAVPGPGPGRLTTALARTSGGPHPLRDVCMDPARCVSPGGAQVQPRGRPVAHTFAGPHTLRDVCVDPARCVSPGGARAVLVAALVGALTGPVVLLAVSWAVKPLYVERYVLATVPLLALAAGAAVRLLPGEAWVRALAAGLVVAAALTGVPAAFAGPFDKTEDLRAAAAHLAAAAQPGDCVAYDPSWARIGLDLYLVHAQPSTGVTLRDVALDPGPAGQDPVGLFPAELPLAAVEANVDACARVWVAGYPGPVGRWRPVPEVTGTALAAAADRFTTAAPADFGDFRLTLWTAAR